MPQPIDDIIADARRCDFNRTCNLADVWMAGMNAAIDDRDFH